MRVRSSDFEQMIVGHESRLSLSTLPPVTDNVIRYVTQTMRNLFFTRWPREVEFPLILAVSTIRRDSSFTSHPNPGLVIHDEGIVDIVAAATRSILSIHRPVSCHIAYRFLVEQLVSNGRPDLAILLCDLIYGENAPYPLTAESAIGKTTVDEIRRIVTVENFEESQFGSQGIFNAAMSPEFQETASAYFLFHELGHYLHQLGVARQWAIELGVPTPAEATEEVYADLTSISCVLFSVRNDIRCTNPRYMTFILGQVLTIAEIHRAFEEMRRGVLELVQNWRKKDFQVRLHRSDPRFDATTRIMTNPETITQLFRLCRSRAKIHTRLLDHFLNYASLIRFQLNRTSGFMLDAIQRISQAEEVNRFLTMYKRQFFESDVALKAVDLVRTCSSAMKDDFLGTLNPHAIPSPFSKRRFENRPNEETTLVLERIGTGRHVNLTMEKRGVNFLLDANDLVTRFTTRT